MSDSSQGPGWWQASDGKWYPPEQHPSKAPVHTFKSRIEGKNADVTIWSDRIEWHLAGGALSMGTARKHGRGSEVIPVKSISSVTTERDGMAFSKVRVITTGNTIDFRVKHADAPPIKDALVQLTLGNHPSQQEHTSTSPAEAQPTASEAPPPGGGDDKVSRLRELAQLREDGILTDDEFEAEKAKILDS